MLCILDGLLLSLSFLPRNIRRGLGSIGGGVGMLVFVRSRAADAEAVARSSRSVWKVCLRLSKRRVRLPMGVPASLAGGKSKPPDMMAGGEVERVRWRVVWWRCGSTSHAACGTKKRRKKRKWLSLA